MKRRRHLESLAQDIRDHVEEETQDNIARGMSPDEARQAARRKFGNTARIHEDAREVWIPVWLDHFFQDTRYALRMLRRNAGFAVVVIVTLALGIGVNTAVFSAIQAVLLRPLPYPNPERLVAYSDGVSAAKAEHFKMGVEAADFSEWRSQAKSFEGLVGYQCNDATLTTSTEASQVRVAWIAGDLWAIAGVRPALGRLFGPQEQPGSIVLSHPLFTRRFRSDPKVIGSTMTLGGKPVTIAGVLPPEFRFLFPQNPQHLNLAAKDVEVYAPAPPPLRASPQRMRMMFVVAKLKPLASSQTALAELRTIQARLLQDHPDRWFAGVDRMDLLPLKERLAGNVRQALLLLQAAGVFVLLIACVNIMNLLLARAAARRREIAIRAAIGAGAARVFRQFLAEGLVLALLGGIAGLVLANVAIGMMSRLAAHTAPRLDETTIDGRVLVFTLAITLASGMLFGFAPAISLWRCSLQHALKEGTGGSSAGSGSLRLRRLLVASELALAIVLLTCAGLMVKSFWRMYTNPQGFAPENTLVMKVSLSGPQYADAGRHGAYVRELLRRIESVPGVQAAGIAKTDGFLLQSKDRSVQPIVDQFQESLVSPGYFGAIGMRLIKGRWIRGTDQPDATIINETMARRVFGNDDPIGRRIDQLGRPVHVIGVVANLKYSKLDAEPGPEMYKAYPLNLAAGGATLTVIIRAPGDPLGLAPLARTMVAGIDPTQPVYNVETLQQALAASIAPRRFNLFLLGTFASAALLMALIGIYGVIAYSVTQRTREIGVRMALGSQRRAVVKMVVRQGVVIALSGIGVGLVIALGFTQMMRTLLYDVAPHDPATFVIVGASLAATAVLACLGPALSASRVDPLTALRHE